MSHLFGYIKEALEDKSTLEDFLKNDVRVRVIGKWKELVRDVPLKEAIADLEKKTEHCRKHNLTILFAYDGKTEMLDAIENMRRPASDDSLKNALWTSFLPPVDLLIRTGGEPHLSAGFMMWLIADSQLYFTETKWPDFDGVELEKALADYSKRERRFGK